MPPKTLILLGGPTASGKTALAIDLARALSTEIISADSRQCYRELRIGVARPRPEELAAVRHHFIATHSLLQPVTAAAFEGYALEQAARLFKQHNHIIVAGGTGLYLRALANGLDAIPPVPEEIRTACRTLYEEGGLPALQGAVAAEDPQFLKGPGASNPHRLLRALEVVRTTGRPLRSFQADRPTERPFRILGVSADLPREELYARINRRVEKMMEEGLLEEVKGLELFRNSKALQTVGYAELFRYLEGSTSLEEAVRDIQQHTRNYAKRQLTWFRNDESYIALPPGRLVSDVLRKLTPDS